jgi:hypothetical protein
VQAIAAVLQHSKSRGSARAVLVAVAEHMNAECPERGCWPSVARIAERAGLSVRQTQRRLRELEDMGEVRREWEKGCRRRCPTYYVTLREEAGRNVMSPGSDVTLRKRDAYGDIGVTLRIGPSAHASNGAGVTRMSPRGDKDDTSLRVTRMSPLPYGDAGVTRTGLDLEPESNRNLTGSVEAQDQERVASEDKAQEPDRSLPEWEESVRHLLEAGQLPKTRYWKRVAYGST